MDIKEKSKGKKYEKEKQMMAQKKMKN